MKFPWPTLELHHSGKVRCEPGWSLGEGWAPRLNDCDLWYVWAGTGTMKLQNRELELKPGVCIWMRPGRHYLAKHDPKDPLGVSFIHFVPRDVAGRPCLEHRALPEEVHQVEDPLFFSAVMSRIVHLWRGYSQLPEEQEGRQAQPPEREPAHTLFRGLLHDLLHTGRRQFSGEGTGRHRTRIESQVALIYEQPRLAPSVGRLAREAGLTLDHYGRVFRRLNGIPPRELIQQARLERACQLLRETPLSVSEVAEQAGYTDVFQFSRLFKKRTGQSPSRWRKG